MAKPEQLGAFPNSTQAAGASPPVSWDVLVVGAGVAGLAAAVELARSGWRTLVLEARTRVGGRVYTEQTAEGVLVEHGAEFVHGQPAELWDVLNEAGLELVERDGAMLVEADQEQGLRSEADQEEGHGFESLEQLASLPGDDLPFAEWLVGSDIPEEEREQLLGYVEGFNAADASRISARSLGIQQQVEDATEGDRAWHLPGGYAQLPEYLARQAGAAGVDLRLGVEVTAIRWRRGQVVLSTVRHGDYRASRCVVTLPLGVLQAANASSPGSVRIEPEPRALFEARWLAMGHVARFTLVFRERWWERAPGPDTDALRQMSFVFTRDRMPPVWWTRHPEAEELPTLVGWIGGPRCTELLGLSTETLGSIACAQLAAVFRVTEEEIRSVLVGTYTHDWTADRFAQGSYSYVPAGALDAPEAIGRPEAATLFFAGEHTDTTGNWGTVHAALHSGRRVAQQIGPK